MNGLGDWLQPAWTALMAALSQRRLHHALLFAAPAGLGKRALADAFAAAALCERADLRHGACGQCRACLLFAAGTHPDLIRVGLELRDDGKQRSEITIDQMRALSQRLALSSQFGGWQLAVIDPADRLNANAANALLKTLEEPATATVIVLLADDPARLPATIRSRCQRIDLPAPTPAAALAWLKVQGVEAAQAQEVLAASLGNPGLALNWIRDSNLALREACARDLAAFERGQRQAQELAEQWSQDRPAERLWFAAVIARDEARKRALAATPSLTARGEIPKLVAWFGHANRARGLLSTTLRIDLLLLDLLRTWPRRDESRQRG
ncbi:MAG: DNA polymerase III subunit delta' [Dokdonella sp.]|uniref:DNA polymerase III subunit delta' n=1 Tax=Dokdonella sp. TaxID=2291710 RepID=UPI0025C5BBCA|nr:DNA polymerase III subunit delta' [Dokdonella sp.]MBZ0222520.1 DNA polymerase III subunit delta' [Dokdonella sp.]